MNGRTKYEKKEGGKKDPSNVEENDTIAKNMLDLSMILM